MMNKRHFTVICIIVALLIGLGVLAVAAGHWGAAQVATHAIEIAGYTWSSSGLVLPPPPFGF